MELMKNLRKEISMYSRLNYLYVKKLGKLCHIGQFLMGNYDISSLHFLSLSENLHR